MHLNVEADRFLLYSKEIGNRLLIKSKKRICSLINVA